MRTRQQVIEERRSIHGCCNRYADNMACDCFDKAQPDVAPCLTSHDVDEIEKKVAELYRLYNVCSKNRLSWASPHKEVDNLMRYINQNFPGYYALQLIAEVRFLQRIVLDLTKQLTDSEKYRHTLSVSLDRTAQ